MKNIFHSHYILWLSRILFGVVFIFSGFVKAVDPLGSTYKFQDYFLSFGMEWLAPLALPLAILQNSLEFLIGVAVLFGIKMRWSSLLGLLFMIFFTPFTLYIALYEPVSDCGCFGDALVISNWATFYKNIFILAASIIIFANRKRFNNIIGEKADWYLVAGIGAIIIIFSIYNLRNLPILDFRPWKVGNNIAEKMTPVQDEIVEFTFIYKNTNTGETDEFGIDDLPSTADGWEFSDRKEKVIQEYIPAPIDEFVIQDEYGFDMADTYLGNSDYQFMLIVYDLHKTNRKSFEKINDFAAKAQDAGHSFIAITGSSFEDIDLFRHNTQAAYPFYQSDAIKLKTIVRANPGLVMMKDWVVLGKWHHRNIPDYEQLMNETR